MTAAFEPEGRQTRVTPQAVFDSPAQRDTVVREYGALDGARETLGRLEAQRERRA